MTTQTSKAAAWFAAVWQSRMVDTVTVDRTTSRGTLDTATMTYTPTTTVVYQGAALVRPAGRPVDRELLDLRSFDRLIVHIPTTATAVQVGDRVKVDTSADGRLVGTVGVVRAVETDGLVTVRRLHVEVDRGSGAV